MPDPRGQELSPPRLWKLPLPAAELHARCLHSLQLALSDTAHRFEQHRGAVAEEVGTGSAASRAGGKRRSEARNPCPPPQEGPQQAGGGPRLRPAASAVPGFCPKPAGKMPFGSAQHVPMNQAQALDLVTQRLFLGIALHLQPRGRSAAGLKHGERFADFTGGFQPRGKHF